LFAFHKITFENLRTQYPKLDQSKLHTYLQQNEYQFILENYDLYNSHATIKEYFSNGVCAGKSLEIPYTQESYDFVVGIHNRLVDLSEKLQTLNNKEILLQLVSGQLKALI